MQRSRKLRLTSVAAASFLAATGLSWHPSLDFLAGSNSGRGLKIDLGRIELGSSAQAKSTGGRVGGGSFRSSSPSRSRSSGSSKSYPSYPRGDSYSPRQTTPDQRNPGYGGGPVIIPIPYGGSGYAQPYPNSQTFPEGNSGNTGGYNANQPSSGRSSNNFWTLVLAVLLLGGGAIAVGSILLASLKSRRGGSATAYSANELENDTVTVSRIQVAVLAQAREVQQKLNEITLTIPTDTPQGLYQLMQEVALILLRVPESWSHVLASSQTVASRQQAEALFTKLAIAQRSQFSVETLTNVGGRKSQSRSYKLDPSDGPAAYIVVTLLIGTADDRPLFTDVNSTSALQATLEKIASIPEEYLMAFQVLWSPQVEGDTLTYDELLTEYSDLRQI
jgi:uncharacterized membrane protein